MSKNESSTGVPLCVDLDGALLKSDLLIESICALLKKNVFYLFLFPLWLARGKAAFKHEIARRVDLDPGLLPFHGPFLEFIKCERASGRRVVLATAANEKYANAVAQRLGVFDQIFSSNAATNLSGRRKLARLVEEFGDGGFEYAANAKIDLPIWEHASGVILVNPEMGVRSVVESKHVIRRVFDDRVGPWFKPYLKAARMHQWLKNVLVFVPLFLGHHLNDLALILQAAMGFIAFGLCASSVYLLNDLLDLSADRQHPTKKYRPLASGNLPIAHGVVLIPLLLGASIMIALFLPPLFLGVLSIYYVTTLAYSFRLKRAALVDVLVLASLYTLRIIAGAVAISANLSFWLLAFSMFLFFSLALVKRYTELAALSDEVETMGRGYRRDDLEMLAQMGSSSGYMAVLVLAFYINSDAVKLLYEHPEVIWLLCPLMLYLVSRIWLLTHRGEMHDDPVVFVMRDHRSQGMVVLGALLLWVAA